MLTTNDQKTNEVAQAKNLKNATISEAKNNFKHSIKQRVVNSVANSGD